MNKISVMSYNIWFDENERDKRLLSLINTIKQNNPDIVCLQEVIPDIAKILNNKLGNTYNYIYPEEIEQSYGCMIFSRYKITKYEDQEYNKTFMGRKLCYAVIEYNMIGNDIPGDNQFIVSKQNVVIATSHFESEFKKINGIKTEQYINARKLLNDLYNTYGPVIFCSDTNILPHEEKYFITNDKNWSDAWKENGCDNLIEYTYDTKLNLNLKNRNFQKEIRSRIDRIIYRGNSVLNPLYFKLIKGDQNNIEPSDHFGIMAEFELIDNTIEI